MDRIEVDRDRVGYFFKEERLFLVSYDAAKSVATGFLLEGFFTIIVAGKQDSKKGWFVIRKGYED